MRFKNELKESVSAENAITVMENTAMKIIAV